MTDKAQEWLKSQLATSKLPLDFKPALPPFEIACDLLAAYASECVRLASNRMMRKAFELSLPIKASDLEQLRAAIEGRE